MAISFFLVWLWRSIAKNVALNRTKMDNPNPERWKAYEADGECQVEIKPPLDERDISIQTRLDDCYGFQQGYGAAVSQVQI